MAGIPRRPPRSRRPSWWQQWGAAFKRFAFSYWGLGTVVLGVAILGGKMFMERNLEVEERLKRADRAFQQGNLYHKRGMIDEAVKSFESAVEIYPRHVYALSNLGTCLREQGNHDKAVLAHRRAVSVMPGRARNHYNLAVSLQSAGDNRAAIDSYRVAIQLDEEQPDAYFNMGVALQDIGEMQNATLAYRRTLELDPNNWGAACNSCNVLQFNGQLEEAEECYKQSGHTFERAWSDITITNVSWNHHDDSCLPSPPHYNKLLSFLPFPPPPSSSPVFHTATGDLGSAAALYLKALEINPNNAIASHALDALRGAKIEGASKEYLSELFDSYSASFDMSLASLQYRSPQLLRVAVDSYLRSEEGKGINTTTWRVLDAGCGTGLSGSDFRNVSAWLAGVDISRKMVQKASERGIYDHLVVGDMTEVLTDFANTGPMDLIISADVLVYYGRLDFLMQTVHKALKPRVGLFAFTVEALPPPPPQSSSKGTAGGRGGEGEEGGEGSAVVEEEHWVLQPTGRYAHSMEYVVAVGDRCGMEVVKVERISPRQDQGKPVDGLLFVMRRRD